MYQRLKIWCFLLASVIAVPSTVVRADHCFNIQGYLSELEYQVSIDRRRFEQDPSKVPEIFRKMVQVFMKDLVDVGVRLRVQLKGWLPKAVLYPLGGFDVSPLALFPDTKVFVIIDKGSPFLTYDAVAGHGKRPIRFQEEHMVRNADIIDGKGEAFRKALSDRMEGRRPKDLPIASFRPLLSFLSRGIGHVKPTQVQMLPMPPGQGVLPAVLGRLVAMFGSVEVLDVMVYQAPVDGRYRSHGTVTVDVGNGPQTIVFFQGALERKPFFPDGEKTAQMIVMSRDNGSTSFLPVWTLSDIDGVVVRGSMDFLQAELPDHSVNYAIAPFLGFLSANNGVLVEGCNYDPRNWEVLPDDLSNGKYPSVVDTMVDLDFRFAYGSGIRAVIFSKNGD